MTENRNIAPAVATSLVFLRAVICGTLLIVLVSEAGLAQATTALWENLQQVKVGQNVSVDRRNSVTKGKFHHFPRMGFRWKSRSS